MVRRHFLKPFSLSLDIHYAQSIFKHRRLLLETGLKVLESTYKISYAALLCIL